MATINQLITNLNTALPVDIETRTSLRNHFLIGEIPIQEHYHAFINTALSIQDDGLFKTTDTPLCIQANTAQEGLHLYADATSDPAWQINLGTGNDLDILNSSGAISMRLSQGRVLETQDLQLNGSATVEGVTNLNDDLNTSNVLVGGDLIKTRLASGLTLSSVSGLKGAELAVGNNTNTLYGLLSRATGTGTNSKYGVRAEAQGSTTSGSAGTKFGIYSQALGDDTGAKYGTYSQADGDNGTKYGVYGRVSGAGGTKYSLFGYVSENDTSNKYGMYSYASGSNTGNPAGTKYGVYTIANGSDTSSKYGVRAYAQGTGGTKYGLRTTASGTDGDKYGVYGTASGANDDKYGLYGTANGSGGNKYGVYGIASQNDTSPKYGVRGEAAGINGTKYGVLGVSDGNDAYTKYGVRGEASGSGGGKYGVYGWASEDDSSTKYGVRAYAGGNGSGTKYGIFASTGSGGTGTRIAGYFSGNVTVTGTLSKGSGSFLIDHPLDPENKTLRHNFVESPENLCLYRGKVTIGTSGKKLVKLPDYFGALTKAEEATVILTPIGPKASPVSYEWKKDFSGFTIFSSGETVVSYLVMADRDDPAIQHLGRPVEEDKGEGNFEKGTYIHAEAYQAVMGGSKKGKTKTKTRGLAAASSAEGSEEDYYLKRQYQPEGVEMEEELQPTPKAKVPESVESEEPVLPEEPIDETP